MRTCQLPLSAALASSLSIAAAGEHVHSRAVTEARTQGPQQRVSPMKLIAGGCRRCRRSVLTIPRDGDCSTDVRIRRSTCRGVATYPYYCGREHVGHNRNHDYFIKSRRTDGTVTESDLHGIGCVICLDFEQGHGAVYHHPHRRRDLKWGAAANAAYNRTSWQLLRSAFPIDNAPPRSRASSRHCTKVCTSGPSPDIPKATVAPLSLRILT
jgi:Protein of unknown function with PCYCGC motif